MIVDTIRVVKRSSEVEIFSPQKIQRSLLLAFQSVTPGSIPNVTPIVHRIMDKLLDRLKGGDIDVDDIGHAVEESLMNAGYTDVARAYIIYRHEQHLASKKHPDSGCLPDYAHVSKYARWRAELGRREVYAETVDRDRDMHIRRWPQYTDEIREAFGFVHRKQILPAMRSMQFAGAAMERQNARGYNCAFTLVDRWRAFAESFYLLLCGCGVGYSVQWQHVECLDAVMMVDKRKVVHYIIEDTLEGWADALDELVKSFSPGNTVTGCWVEYSYHKIRGEGVPLKTSGGRAPGHLPLRRALEAIRLVLLSSEGRRLRPIECSDIMCLLAEAVLAGGIRRSSLCGLFSSHDTEMLYAKARGNFRPAYGGDPGLNPQREMVNISAVLLRSSVHRSVFDRIIRIAQENYGDPGFFFTDNLDYGTNPCYEIGLNPILRTFCAGCATLPTAGCRGCKYETGFSFCNLCEINMSTVDGLDDFLARASAAAIIGTLQAAYTNFDYLGRVTEEIARREALLGVGMTGIQDNRLVALDPAFMRLAAAAAVEVNQKWAQRLGINPAARVTTVKPSGTASLILGCVGSGVHPQWSSRYFRRVTANPLEAAAREFKRVNPHMVEVKPNGDWSLVFPIEVRAGARTVKEVKCLDFISDVLSVYKNWILPGTALPESSPGLTHNVSCTVTLREGDLSLVCDAVWENRNQLAALSFVPDTIDVRFAYAPLQEVKTPEDEARWDRLVANYRKIDWAEMLEAEDGTIMEMGVACGGGGCEVK
jgi:ribonucleoside-diphosphate reductase alpha chain